MSPNEVIDRLRAHAPQLRAMGVERAALFGSTARGEAGPDSDIDIAVQIEPGFCRDLWTYAGVVHAIQDLFPGKVDVADFDRLRPAVRANLEREGVYAF